MNVDLSRRAGKVAGSTAAWRALSRWDKGRFATATRTATSFSALNKKWQQVIRVGEQELKRLSVAMQKEA